MGVYVPGMEMPYSCSECPFLSKYTEVTLRTGIYKKIAHCIFAPDTIEDPWRDMAWLIAKTEPYCPLVNLNK